jgi:hypothetical protein
MMASIEASSQNSNLQDTAQYANIAKGKMYKFDTPPNYPLCSDAGDAFQLTDGRYTSGYFWTQKTTVGWQMKRPVIITIDLGKIDPIRGVSYNTAAGAAGVTWPLSVHILVSDDGTHYFPTGELIVLSNKRDAPPAKGYAAHRYWIDSLRSHGRYVQLIIDPGGPYCFVDEIEIYRGEDSWLTQQPMGIKSGGGLNFFQTNATNNSIKSRLNADLRDTIADMKGSNLGNKETAALLAELNDIEIAIPKMPLVDPKSFSAIFPINDLQARVFSVLAKMRRLKGMPHIETWVSHPLDYITPTQKSNSTSRRQIEMAMIRGEWRSAVFNMTNSQPLPAQIQFSINGLPGGNNPDYVSVYEVQWTDTIELKPIAAALIKMAHTKSGYSTIIPAGMTRQIWLTFHPMNIAPGNYKGKVIMESKGNKQEIPLKIRLFPFVFPTKPTLHVGGWDYTDSDAMYGVTATNRATLIAHLQERFVDSPWASSGVMPYGSFDPKGYFVQKPDTSRFDTWIARWPNASRYCVFLNVGASLAGAKMGSEAFVAKVKSWIDFWVEHAATKGIKPAQLVLLLLDEPSKNEQDRIIIAWAKAIRAAQPKLILWEDPAYVKPGKALPEMMSSVDVLCPNRVQMLSEGKHFEDFYRKQKAEGRRLDFYSASGPMHLLDPYSYVRLQAWTCWDMGAESTSFWAFGDTGGGNPWNPYLSPPGMNYAPMFLAPDSVTPGKHMEALRESVEDFEYFVMLKDAIANAKTGNPALPKAKELLKSGARRVLDAANVNKLNWSDDKDRWIAEKVRLEILETLVALEYSGRNQRP